MILIIIIVDRKWCNMSTLLEVTLIGTAAGLLGTGFGGLLLSLFNMPKRKTLSFVIAFSGGIMLAIIFQDLIPEALEYGTMSTAIFGLALGIGLLLLLDYFLPHAHVSGNHDKQRASRFIRASILLGTGIAMHNFPEGLAIGTGYIASEKLGLSLALILALHNVPEGMAMACPLKAANAHPLKMIGLCGLAGLPMGIGAFIGSLVGSVSEIFLSTALGFAAGAMLFLVFDELLPSAQEIGKGHSATFGALFGVVIGLIFMILLH